MMINQPCGGGSRASALYEVIRKVRPLYRALVHAVTQNLAGTGITVALRGVLEHLAEHGPQTVPQMGRALLLPRQAVQRVVDHGIALGLIAAQANPAHRRSVLLTLTPQGAAAFRRLREGERRALEEASQELSTADVEACHRVLAHLLAYFGRPAGAPNGDDTALQDVARELADAGD